MPTSSYKKTIASIKRTRTKKLGVMITRGFLMYRRKQEEALYNMLCEEFMALGGVYVKFLQGVLLQSRIMRKWHNPEKLKIFENLDHEPIDLARFLQRELPADKLGQIASVQPEPFAAGSFGQVYFAQLRNGQSVVIKVLRPMIRELLQHDLKLLNRFSKAFFGKLYKNMSVDIQSAFDDFSRATMNETDYRREAAFATEMYNHYKNHAVIHIPQTHLELCTDNMIVQDYVDGVSLAHIVKIHEQGVDPVQYVRESTGSDLEYLLSTFGYESLIGIFEMARIQGDPHPGNIRILRDNKIGLIDFGISAAAPSDKSGLFGMLDTYDKIIKGSQSALDMFEQGMKFFVSDLYRSLKSISAYMNKGNNRDYVTEVSQVASKIFSDATGTDIVNSDMRTDPGVLNAINKVINKGNRFGLVLKLEATDVIRAIQTYTSLLSRLGLYQSIMPNTLDRVVEHVRTNHPEVASDNGSMMDIGVAIETITNWLERVADRDPALFRQITQAINSQRSTGVQLETEGTEQ